MAWSPQARRAALIARRRKARGRAKPVGRTRRAGKEVKRRYQAGHRGPGANYRRTRDRYNSQGYYKNRTGNKNSKKAGKAQRGYRKASVAYSHLAPAVSATTGISYLRHKKAVKKGTVNMSRKQRVTKTATRRSSAIKKKTSGKSR